MTARCQGRHFSKRAVLNRKRFPQKFLNRPGALKAGVVDPLPFVIGGVGKERMLPVW